MKNIYSPIIKKLVEHIGSKATTEIGQAKAALRHPDSFRFFSAEKHKLPQPWILDRLPVGADIQLDNSILYGYHFVSVSNSQVASRAAEVIGKCGQKSNYGIGSPRIYGPAYQRRWDTIRYRGSYKGYTGSYLNQDYQSCVGISKSGKSAVVIQECKLIRRIIAPKGMMFRKDENGILLRRLSDQMDYHPNSTEWLAKNFATVVRQQMATNWRKRQEAKQATRKLAKDRAEQTRIRTIYERELNTTMVRVEDSRRAGNCVAGTLAFAERKLGLSREEVVAGSYLLAVPAPKLLRVANGDQTRVESAIWAAWQRETTVSI